jgi:GT2 family glycosyltransferase
MSVAVLAVIPAYRRPELLARALASLADQGPALRGVLVVNNSSDAATTRVAAAARVKTEVLDLGCNLGTTGGIAAGMKVMCRDANLTHVWILDDDACATPGALDAMVESLQRASAEAAAPLLTDETGAVRWFPGPLPGAAWDLVRKAPTPAQFLAECGDQPLPWNWAMWASLLISRRAIETIGFPRLDLWYQYSDLEYTLRLTARFRGVLAPRAVCEHLPPPESPEQRRRKDYLGLQNGNFVNFHLPHAWRALRHTPGNHVRYLRRHGCTLTTVREAAQAFFRGAILGRVADRVLFEDDQRRAEAALRSWETRVA